MQDRYGAGRRLIKEIPMSQYLLSVYHDGRVSRLELHQREAFTVFARHVITHRVFRGSITTKSV